MSVTSFVPEIGHSGSYSPSVSAVALVPLLRHSRAHFPEGTVSLSLLSLKTVMAPDQAQNLCPGIAVDHRLLSGQFPHSDAFCCFLGVQGSHRAVEWLASPLLACQEASSPTLCLGPHSCPTKRSLCTPVTLPLPTQSLLSFHPGSDQGTSSSYCLVSSLREAPRSTLPDLRTIFFGAPPFLHTCSFLAHT